MSVARGARTTARPDRSEQRGAVVCDGRGMSSVRGDDGLVIRAVKEDELDAYRACMQAGFGGDPGGDPDRPARLRAILERDRNFCAFDGARLVGTCATWSMTVGVPGGVVPMAGLTMVSVWPTYRRRGLLRRMLDGHLADAAARGEPLSGLWASDAPIYGRFGYGVAAWGDEVTCGPDPGFGRGRALDRMELLSDDEAATALPPLYAACQRRRPGVFSRNELWWRWRRFADRPEQRRGRSPRVHALALRDGAPTGYVVYRTSLSFDDGRPAGTVDLDELVALDARAEATLWEHVTHRDLFPRVSWWNAPVDSLAPWLAADPRVVVRRRRADSLWLRIGDPGAALAGRAYAADGALTLAVLDAMSGARTTWALTVEGGRATCAATESAADLELDQAALGSIYLGTVPPSLLAGTGAIRGDAHALALADRLFTWPIAPWCPEIF